MSGGGGDAAAGAAWAWAGGGGGGDEPGWQDTDSEGPWLFEGMDEDGDEDEAGEQQRGAPALLLLSPEAAHAAGGGPRPAHLRGGRQQEQQQEQEPQQEQEQQQEQQLAEGAALGGAAPPTRPLGLHQHIAALIHRRVAALIQQQQQQPGGGQAGGAAGDGGGEQGSGSGSSSPLSPGNSGEGEAEEGDGSNGADGCTLFDPNVTASHQYLGDVDELEGSYGLLPEGTRARLPLLLLDGVVLFPGCQLPLLLSTTQEQHLLQRALTAPPPLTRLLAVLPSPRSGVRPSNGHLVCCTAEVRHMRRHEDEGAVAVLALGRQRAEVLLQHQHMAQSQLSVLVSISSEGCQDDVPGPMRQLAAAIHPALARPWDLRLLVARVRSLLQLVLMPVASFQGTPLQLSYWIAHNLPLQPATRQLLLQAPGPAERLRLLLGLLERLDQMACSVCGQHLATTADLQAMTSEGISGTFVNSHGFVHEMVTLRRVRGVQLEGAPETEYSWFPGYAWTVGYCSRCGQHMGWRFSAVQADLAPRIFWGLRRAVLACSTRPGGGDGQQHEGQEGQDAAAPRLVIQLGQLPHGGGEGE